MKRSAGGVRKITAVQRLLCLLAVAASASVHGQEVPGCGNLTNAYGPWDYTNPVHFAEKLEVVENTHFRPETERLEKDLDDGRPPGKNLDYTLRAFPNHHRALNTMSRFRLRTKQDPPPGMRYTADCWFKRAIAFRPEDGVVRMIYGILLHRKGDLQGALEQYEHALDRLGNSPELHYNVGLLYLDLEDFDAAVRHARIAYAGGFPLPGLRNRLRGSGHWNDVASTSSTKLSSSPSPTATSLDKSRNTASAASQ